MQKGALDGSARSVIPLPLLSLTVMVYMLVFRLPFPFVEEASSPCLRRRVIQYHTHTHMTGMTGPDCAVM